MKMMAFGLITSWKIGRERIETVINFIILDSKITADGDCNHEIKRCLVFRRKTVTNLDSILRSWDISLPTKVQLVKAMFLKVVMYAFIGKTDVEAETPIRWPPDVKSWLIGKDPDAGKDWGQEEKGMTEDKMIGWHHRLNGHEFGWTPGVGDGQGGLVCCGSWGHKESNTTERLNWTELYEYESCTVKKADNWRIDASELSCWRILLRVPWTARRSNQSVLKEISPEYSLEWLRLKLKLQYFGQLLQRTDSLKNTLMLGKIENRKRRGWDGWMASSTQWLWIWASSEIRWRAGKSGMLQSMGSQKVRNGWVTELN